jgi:2-oxoglutarate dehydrogenase E2 component (dihydrolipoamide succinyltransferase)
MAKVELLLPAMGEGIIEATITRWLVADGQQVSIDQPLVEVATDKVDSEIPSPADGIIARLVYHEGDIPKVGEVIAVIETAAPESAGDHEPEATEVVHSPEKYTDQFIHKTGHAVYKDEILISPLVRMLARQRGISSRDLKSIKGSGKDGRITRDDIIRNSSIGLISGRNHDHETEPEGSFSESFQSKQIVTAGPEDEVVEMDRVRKIIASHVTMSKRMAPHVTSFLEADVTAIVDWRERIKESFHHRENVRLTYTSVFIEATVHALKEFPRINAVISGETIIVRKNIHIGLATALPDGNLIVPVIKNADHENLASLARKVADLANRAKNGSLVPAEIKEGTFTITNIGQFNSLTGTPVINQPQSAILALGTITKKPWAVKTDKGYGVAIRDIIMLSLTYDHRIIDGALGGNFLSRIAWHLENFNTGREV